MGKAIRMSQSACVCHNLELNHFTNIFFEGDTAAHVRVASMVNAANMSVE